MLPMMDYCSTHKIPFVDTRQKFVAYGIDSSNWQAIQWPIDGHYNNQGYNYLAQSISSEVLEKIRPLMDSLAVKNKSLVRQIIALGLLLKYQTQSD